MSVLAGLVAVGATAAVASSGSYGPPPRYVGDLTYERVIETESTAARCYLTLGVEPDGQTVDELTVRHFEKAKRFLASISVEQLAAEAEAGDNMWSDARRRELARDEPDLELVNSMLVAQISDEFTAQGLLGHGVSLQTEYGCEPR